MLRFLLAGFSLLLYLPHWAQTQPYFQQKTDYTIQVLLDDATHTLHAQEQLVYTNNSPDTLDYIFFHLWPNAYKNRETQLAKNMLEEGSTVTAFAEREMLGYIDSLAFSSGGAPLIWEYHNQHIDICKVFLEEPLIPGSSVEISTPFRVHLPSAKISRLGHIGQSYQITQWYPKPAVYDRAGWHPMPYLNQGEFYSEYGSYDVEITLPENYVVGATGDLQSEAEKLRLLQLVEKTEAWVKENESQDSWSEVRGNTSYPASSDTMKTIRFTQSKVHDFAWFADKRFRVLKGEVELPYSGEIVDVWTMFTDREARLWSKSIEYMQDAVYYYSLWNGDYPYQQATAVDGTIAAGGGMEYPNVTIIGTAGSSGTLERVIVHEVGHNWFYGILGSNERDHPWMDEGINSYNELRYFDTKYPERGVLGSTTKKIERFTATENLRGKDAFLLFYLLPAALNVDQPIEEVSANYMPINYGAIVYAKSAVVFNYLRGYLGDSLIDACQRAYFEEWKFKHPQPADLREVYERVSGRNLSWFFDGLIGTDEQIDFKVNAWKSKSGTDYLKISNSAAFKLPVPLVAKGDTMATWVPPFKGDTLIKMDRAHIRIDPSLQTPDISWRNNSIAPSGLFKRWEQPQLKFLAGLEQPERTTIYWSPVLSWNAPNGLMPGLVLHNHSVPFHRFNYHIVPLYGLGSGRLNGLAKFNLNFSQFKSVLESAEVGVKGKSFGYAKDVDAIGIDGGLSYFRVEPYLLFRLQPKRSRSYWRHSITLSTVAVRTEDRRFLQTSDPRVFTIVPFNDDRWYARVRHLLTSGHPIAPATVATNLELTDQFVGRFDLEVIQKLKPKKFADYTIRAFFGSIINPDGVNTPPNYNWRMDGVTWVNDYAFDYFFLRRNEPRDWQQKEAQGAFKVPTGVGSSNSWIGAANLKVKLHGLPLGAFVDVGTSPNESFMFNTGASLILVPDIFEVHVPMLYSESIRRSLEVNNFSFGERIRVSLNLPLADPVRILSKLGG